MESTIHYPACPVCASTDIRFVFTVKDYTVSHLDYGIWCCGSCTLRFTQDVPDAASIAAYYKAESYISHTDTSKGLINNLYKRVRKYTLMQKRKLIGSSTGMGAGQLLDIGSGTGAFLNEMRSGGWQVTGLEPDADARKRARDLYAIDTLDMKALDDLPSATYDAITLWHVLEHVHDLDGTIRQMKRLLKAGGRIIIAVPNYCSFDASAYKQYWAAYDVPRHLYHFSPQAMDVLMSRYGAKIAAYHPMWFDSYYVSLLSSQYRNGRANWLGSLWTGTWSNILALLNKRKCSSIIYVIR